MVRFSSYPEVGVAGFYVYPEVGAIVFSGYPAVGVAGFYVYPEVGAIVFSGYPAVGVAGFYVYPEVGADGFTGSIVDGFGVSGTSGSGSFYGPSLGAGGFTGLIVGFSGGSTFGSGGLSICGIQEYFKNSSEVTSGFSNPSKPISILLGVNSSTLVTKPGPYLNPF